ncbi:hypothetical protein MKW98_019558 [Papaver atlanticum]|uniref:Uncharacterized protein n=1 Tax=Papaver atlanticum TaxID=357466 RepID=A0AAD4X9N2_9MAGN|nr:hypothetical protein MKW98_019558 [Papaver atlanticum]
METQAAAASQKMEVERAKQEEEDDDEEMSFPTASQKTEYIAVFVGNCKIKISQILRRSYHKPKTSNKGGRDHGG